MKGPILITGATGTVGTFLVKKLAEAGVQVRAGVRSVERAAGFTDPHIEVVPFDTENNASLAPAFVGVETVFILAPFSPNIEETEKLIAACAKAAGARRIVKLSVMGAEKESGKTEMGKAHGEVEKFIASLGLDYTFLRPNFFMQNFVTSHGGSIKKDGKIYLPWGTGRVSFVDARDVASAAAAVLTTGGHEGKMYEITGGAALGVSEVAEVFSKILGHTIEYVDEKEEKTRERFETVGTPPWMTEALLSLYGACRAGDHADVSGDFTHLTGRDPITFEQFVRDYAALFAS